ncbi:ATP-binding protein, partial [Klebsiella pneumoniae]|nr:ATP-binding protein [Klebsiella pneumoniae]
RTHGVVRLSLSPAHAAGQHTLCVEDTGPGLSAGQLARLFQPFERLGQDTSQIEGTGLGLIITRSLTEAMGGQLEIR